MPKNNFLNANGEMAALIKSHDWQHTSVGAMDTWPQSLCTTLSIILNSKFPMILFWGKQLTCFYNDAYLTSLGNNGKHPGALAKSGEEFWPETWPIIKPFIDRVLAGGDSVWSEDQLIQIYRNEKIEDVYRNFSYGAVTDESGDIAGVFVTCMETTEKVVTQKKAKESKDLLQFAIDAAEIATWDLNVETHIITGNDRLKEWFELPAEADISFDFFINVVAEKDRKRVADAIVNALQISGGKYDIEYTLITKSKAERIIRAKGIAFFNINGQGYRINGTMQDITKKAVALRALTESERNLRNLVMQAPVAISIARGEFHIVEIANDRMIELWGRSRDEVMNKPLFEALPEAGDQSLEELLENVFRTGERFSSSELSVNLSRNGKLETVFVNFVYEAMKDGDGIISGILIVATDVTEQVIARRKIEEAEERARLAAEAADLGTFDFNLITGKMITSFRFAGIFGFDHPVSRSEYASVIHHDDLAVQTLAHEAALKTGSMFYQARVIWKNKTMHWVRAEGKVYYDEQETPLRMLGTLLDITAQKKAEEELHKAHHRLEIALEAGGLGSYEYNIESGNIKYNEQFKIIYGLQKRRFKYDDMVKIIIPPYRERFKKALEESILNRSQYNEEYQVKWPDNSIHWIKSTGNAAYDVAGKPVHFSGVAFDISEHKQMLQQKDDFIGIASHELKTPVTIIKAYTQILEESFRSKGDSNSADQLGKMHVQVNKLTGLIEDLLDVTKTRSGRMQYNSTCFDFKELINDIVADVQPTALNHKIQVKMNNTQIVYADRERIGQVITNFISNAIKYSPYANKIVLQTKAEGGKITFSVKDFGVGINSEMHEKVFEQFYRVSGNQQNTYPGIGLGLYISAEIIKRAGGKIWVESAEGKGSVFNFTIPVNSIANCN